MRALTQFFSDTSLEARTRRTILWSNLLFEPFMSLLILLKFILYKNLQATPLQIVLLVMTKPAVSIFSFYWSSIVVRQKRKLRSNLIIAEVIARIPFMLFFFFDSPSFVIFAAAIYMFFSRASIPAWVEILKLNLEKEDRQKWFSRGMALAYLEGVLLALFIGKFLDASPNNWKILFLLFSCIGLIGTYFKYQLPIKTEAESLPSKKEELPFLKRILYPWKTTYLLMKQRPDFARFQWGYMACGFGIMLFLPVLPQFFNQALHLSYKDLSLARSFFYCLAFVLSSPFWSRWLNQLSINMFTTVVFIAVGLFPFLLIFGQFTVLWIYFAYALYGFAQAGSRLIWNLSGPIFAKEEDSSVYSSVNIVTVGIRGCIAPPLGGLLCSLTNPLSVLVAGMLLSFFGGYLMLSNHKSVIPVRN